MLLVHGEPAHKTDLAHDSRNPVTTSHVSSLLSLAFHSIVALPVANDREALETAIR